MGQRVPLSPVTVSFFGDCFPPFFFGEGFLTPQTPLNVIFCCVLPLEFGLPPLVLLLSFLGAPPEPFGGPGFFLPLDIPAEPLAIDNGLISDKDSDLRAYQR